MVSSAGRSMMKLPAGGNASMIAQRIIADVDAEPVAMLGSVTPAQLAHASFLAPSLGERERLATSGIAATMTFPLRIDGEPVGSVQADHPSPRRCSAERRSVAHLFAERLVARMARQGWKP